MKGQRQQWLAESRGIKGNRTVVMDDGIGCDQRTPPRILPWCHGEHACFPCSFHPCSDLPRSVRGPDMRMDDEGDPVEICGQLSSKTLADVRSDAQNGVGSPSGGDHDQPLRVEESQSSAVEFALRLARMQSIQARVPDDGHLDLGLLACNCRCLSQVSESHRCGLRFRACAARTGHGKDASARQRCLLTETAAVQSEQQRCVEAVQTAAKAGAHREIEAARDGFRPRDMQGVDCVRGVQRSPAECAWLLILDSEDDLNSRIRQHFVQEFHVPQRRDERAADDEYGALVPDGAKLLRLKGELAC